MATSSKAKKKTVRLASGRKRARQDVKLNAANTALRSKFRTVVKNVQKAVATGDKAKATELFASAQSVIDSVADKGMFTRTKPRATRAAWRPRSRHWRRRRRRPQPEATALHIKARLGGLCHFCAGNTHTSPSCNSLSRAKFITKSQAIGSMPRSASLTITHFTPPTTVGTQ